MTTDIICPPESPGIVSHILTCTVRIPPQKGLTGITFTNEPADPENGTLDPWITIDVDITDQIKYTDTDRFLCPFAGDSTNEDGDLIETIVVKGYKDKENISHATTSGVTSYKHEGSQGIDAKTTTE